MMVRSIPPGIRETLVDRLQARGTQSLKSFLGLFNRSPPGCSVLLNRAGMGAVNFAIQSRNHFMDAVRNYPGLAQTAENYFLYSSDHPTRVRVLPQTTVIHTFVKINAKKWCTKMFCEYIAPGPGANLRVGTIHSFLLVAFTVGDDRDSKCYEVFVRVLAFEKAALKAVGPADCGHYRVQVRTRKKPQIVHVERLVTLLAQVPDNRGTGGVVRAREEYIFNAPVPEAKTSYLVPVAQAFAAT
jgi:hypothetical protein